MDQFEQQYCCEYIHDETSDAYLQCWLAYHRAANRVDGHIKRPGNPEELKLIQIAALAGKQAMDHKLSQLDLYKPCNSDKGWQRAKLDALRIIDNEEHIGSSQS